MRRFRCPGCGGWFPEDPEPEFVPVIPTEDSPEHPSNFRGKSCSVAMCTPCVSKFKGIPLEDRTLHMVDLNPPPRSMQKKGPSGRVRH